MIPATQMVKHKWEKINTILDTEHAIETVLLDYPFLRNKLISVLEQERLIACDQLEDWKEQADKESKEDKARITPIEELVEVRQ